MDTYFLLHVFPVGSITIHQLVGSFHLGTDRNQTAETAASE